MPTEKKLDDIFEGLDHDLNEAPMTAPAPAPDLAQAGFIEKCPACRGSGRFHSFRGRDLGKCFKCDGAGQKTFKTSPEARANARVNNAIKANKRDAEKAAWREAHKDLIRWIETEADRFRTGKTTFDFIAKMSEAITEFGWLTDNQLAAVQKCKAKSDERQATWKAKRETDAVAIDCSKIEQAFDRARANGLSRKLKLHFPHFNISPDRNGTLWVNSLTHTNDRGLPAAFGKIVDGKLTTFRLATPEIVEEIKAFAADPASNARVTGKRKDFGICCCCGATLTDPKSIEAGIGPICASKWGF